MSRNKRRALLAALTLLLLWVTAGITLCESALRVPRRLPRHRPGAVQIAAADKVTLHGSFLRAPGGTDCVMLLHGIADSRALGFAPMFLEAGYSVLAPDLRGHGMSGGELVSFGVLERRDVLLWAEWLRSRGCRRLYGLGESLGGAVLIQAAAEAPVFSAIVAECSYRDLQSVAEYRIARVVGGLRWWSQAVAKAILPPALVYARVRYSLDMSLASPLISARRLDTPLLLIHGAADVNTPPEHSEAIAGAARGSTLWLVRGAAHTRASATAPDEFRRRVLSHFRLSEDRAR